MDSKIKEILQQCEEFVDSSTPEELIAYHNSLNINYDDYFNEPEHTVDGRMNLCEGVSDETN